MVYHVVSTKLTEDEHKQLLKICEKIDCTPFQFIKESIKRSVNEIQEAGILDESIAKSEKKSKTKKEKIKSTKNVPSRPKKSSKPEKIEIVDEEIQIEENIDEEAAQTQTHKDDHEELMYKQYDAISDVQELIKIYAELREKPDLSEDDIQRLTIIHQIITQRMSK